MLNFSYGTVFRSLLSSNCWEILRADLVHKNLSNAKNSKSNRINFMISNSVCSVITPVNTVEFTDFDFEQSSNRMPIECAFGPCRMLIANYFFMTRLLRRNLSASMGRVLETPRDEVSSEIGRDHGMLQASQLLHRQEDRDTTAREGWPHRISA